jgi:outer membrane receptor for ferrienterochelin and colicin
VEYKFLFWIIYDTSSLERGVSQAKTNQKTKSGDLDMRKIFSKKKLETLVLITIIICLSSTGVSAQAVLEEVVVTAQKREQNMQDVPVSISAFTGEALKETVIKDVFDLQANVPGLRVEQS